AKRHEDPGGTHVRRIDLVRDEEIECESIEDHRNLEEVPEVVRWIGHLRRRQASERAGDGQITRADTVAPDEAEAPEVHVDQHEQRQEHGREEGTENRCLRHRFLPEGETGACVRCIAACSPGFTNGALLYTAVVAARWRGFMRRFPTNRRSAPLTEASG